MFKLENIKSYRMSRDLSNKIWGTVSKWNILAQKTLGEQLIRSTDSISANIAEGFGRFHKKDKVKFYYNARASTFETAHWINTALERQLIDSNTHLEWITTLRSLPKEINILIKLTINNLKQ